MIYWAFRGCRGCGYRWFGLPNHFHSLACQEHAAARVERAG